MPGFEIDESKLRNAVEKDERWLDTWYSKDFVGRVFFGLILGSWFAVFIAIGLALLAGLVLLFIGSADFRIGVAIFIALMIIPGLLAGLPSKRR